MSVSQMAFEDKETPVGSFFFSKSSNICILQGKQF